MNNEASPALQYWQSELATKGEATRQKYARAGVWNGQMKIENSNDFDIKLQLKQTELELEGIMTICSIEADSVIVEESIKGVFVNDKVTIYGVSYTFLRKKLFHSWNLDSFQGTLSNEGNLISGKCTDSGGNDGIFSLKKSS